MEKKSHEKKIEEIKALKRRGLKNQDLSDLFYFLFLDEMNQNRRIKAD
jgi:hypothetical protein